LGKVSITVPSTSNFSSFFGMNLLLPRSRQNHLKTLKF
jgi:hypothetical protein